MRQLVWGKRNDCQAICHGDFLQVSSANATLSLIFEKNLFAMSLIKPEKTSPVGNQGTGSLQILLALSVNDRREAVAEDLRQLAPQFSTISAHVLAGALDVPDHWRPCDEWSFTCFAPIVSA